jgi:hypothetical protein
MGSMVAAITREERRESREDLFIAGEFYHAGRVVSISWGWRNFKMHSLTEAYFYILRSSSRKLFSSTFPAQELTGHFPQNVFFSDVDL